MRAHVIVIRGCVRIVITTRADREIHNITADIVKHMAVSKPEKFQPDKSFSFPKRTFGRTTRSFRPEWCELFPWLHYSIDQDAAFCHLCMTAQHEGKFLASTKRDPAFVSRGYTYWKEATTAFKKHQTSDCHKEAIEAIVSLPQQVQDVGELLSRSYQEEKATNRRMLLKIVRCIKFLARQGLPLRGVGSDSDSNLMQLLQMECHECPELQTWLRKKTDKYTSHDVQNEIMRTMALMILRQVSHNIKSSGWYTILADECTDVANREQFTICVRWVGEDLHDHEDFLGLYQMSTIDASSLVRAIKDTLLRMNIPLSHCRGQCYDGASNMSGSRSGVATQIAKEEERALYLHCFGHALNLAVADSVKKSKVCCDALETAMEVTKLVKFSPKRNALFDQIKSEDEHSFGSGIRSFCPTRWTVRGDAIASILDNHHALMQLWDECLETRLEPDIKGRIVGVQAQMGQFHRLFGLKLCERVLKVTDNLSRTLQLESLSATEAHQLAEMTCTTLRNMRTEEAFDLFFQRMELLRQEAGAQEPSLPRKRKTPRRFEIGDAEAYHSSSVEQHYRRVYYEVLDSAVSSITDRFDQPGYATYSNLEALLLKAAHKDDFTHEIKAVTSVYKDDLNASELATQLEVFGASFESTDTPSTIHDVIKHLKGLSTSQRRLLEQVCRVCRLLLVLPATNAASERSFSVMRRLKSYLRSTMSQPRLNHAMALNIYKELVDDLDLRAVASDFVGSNEHRLRLFGSFTV